MDENREWVIAFVGGKTLVGVRIDDLYLSPVYDLQSGPVPAGESRMGIATMATPVLMFPSLRRFPVGDSPFVIVSELSDADRRAVMRAVDAAEKMAEQIRASQSGIVTANSMPKAKAR